MAADGPSGLIETTMMTSVRHPVELGRRSLPRSMMLIALSGTQTVGTMVGMAVTGVVSGVRVRSSRVGLCRGRALGVMLGVGVTEGTGERDGVVLGRPVAGGSGVAVQVIGMELDRVAMCEGVKVGVGEIKGVGVKEATLPIAVGSGRGRMGFKYRCLIPTSSRIAAHIRNMSSMMRCQLIRVFDGVSKLSV
jgi:hypothetical protein